MPYEIVLDGNRRGVWYVDLNKVVYKPGFIELMYCTILTPLLATTLLAFNNLCLGMECSRGVMSLLKEPVVALIQ